MTRLRLLYSSVVLVCLLSAVGYAQGFMLSVPRASQRAVVTQRIGLTDITVSYHRPLVNDRKVWGDLVPYDQVWRAGANENTTITFSDPVTIEGQALPKGTYGVHMIPGKETWTVIFSRNTNDWGSFFYDEKADALRVTVKPTASEMHNALAYDFDDPKADSTLVTMRWEKLAVPFRVGVDSNRIAAASIRDQLRGMPQFNWQGWDEGANFLLAQKYDLEDALRYTQRSIDTEERFDNWMTRSQVLTALNRTQEAEAAKTKALSIATPLQTHIYARTLQGQKKGDEAYKIFRANFAKNPDYWFTHSGMARVYSSEGKFDEAAREMKIAFDKAPEQNKVFIQAQIKKLEAKQDINP